MTKKKLFILISAVAAAILATVLVVLPASRTSALREQLELGERYLSELDYESALLAYNKALEIDPRSVEAQSGLYDTTMAYVDVLKNGGVPEYIWSLMERLSIYFPEDSEIWHILLHIVEDAGNEQLTAAALQLLQERFGLNKEVFYQITEEQLYELSRVETLRCSLCARESIRVVALTAKGELLSYNNHYYMIVDDELEWTFARAWCEESGGYLVTVTSAEEQAFLAEAMKQHEKNNPSLLESYWMGGIFRDGRWGWITDEPFAYIHWAPGEPNGYEENMVMQMYTSLNFYSYNHYCWDDTWFDGDKGGGIRNQGLICEWDERPTLVE